MSTIINSKKMELSSLKPKKYSKYFIKLTARALGKNEWSIIWNIYGIHTTLVILIYYG